jgi:hypothetical protein
MMVGKTPESDMGFFGCLQGRPAPDCKTTSARTCCPAKIRLGRTSDHGWIVVEHVEEHNHEMSESYGETKQWPSHHHLDIYTQSLIRKLRENNIGITKLYSILGTFFGKMANVPTTKRCLKTLCHKINREEAEDDINKTLLLFSELMKDDPGYKYVIDRDEDGRIRTLMWSNSKSRMQYSHFGDAITFDTTYKTNLYEMPFGLFVGVNNHFQSVLLAGVLMTDETIETFQWIFKEFAKLMGGKEPKTILTGTQVLFRSQHLLYIVSYKAMEVTNRTECVQTFFLHLKCSGREVIRLSVFFVCADQCRAMEVAIDAVWKGTVHRWCKWHVLKRVCECVPVYNASLEFRDKFHKLLNEMMTKEEFQVEWDALMKEYGLEKNTFLEQIYATREIWVKCYFKDVFCARMTSTQRSESANMMLKNIVPPNSTLHKFVEQYDKLQYIRDEEENYQEKLSKMVSVLWLH